MSEAWFAWVLSELGQGLLDDLSSSISRRPCQRVATMCAGTDSPLLVLKAFNAAVYKHFGTSRDMTCIEHVLSCEIHDQKREFLQKLILGCACDASSTKACTCGIRTRLFRDATKLQDSAFDYSTRQEVAVELCDELWAGFPCTDVSSLHGAKARRKSMAVVREGSQRTGTVFEAICEYLNFLAEKKKQIKRQVQLSASCSHLPCAHIGERDRLASDDRSRLQQSGLLRV